MGGGKAFGSLLIKKKKQNKKELKVFAKGMILLLIHK